MTVDAMYKEGQGAPWEEMPGGEVSEEIEVGTFEVEPATVRAELGLTINTGNFSSVRVGGSVTLPCYAEEAPDAWDRAFDLVELKVKGTAQDAIAYAKGRKRG